MCYIKRQLGKQWFIIFSKLSSSSYPLLWIFTMLQCHSSVLHSTACFSLCCVRFIAPFPWGELTHCNTFMHATLYSNLALLNTWLSLVELSCEGNTVSECRHWRGRKSSVENPGRMSFSLLLFPGWVPWTSKSRTVSKWATQHINEGTKIYPVSTFMCL